MQNIVVKYTDYLNFDINWLNLVSSVVYTIRIFRS